MSRPRVSRLAIVTIAFAGHLATVSWAQSAGAILGQIERLAALGSKGDQELSESIAGQIEAHPKGVAQLLLPKLKEPSATESQLATYVWALGWAKDPSVTGDIIDLYRRSSSNWVQGNCLRALAMIQGKTAGDFLVSALDARTDEDERYSILDLLSEMQYEPALSRTEEILRLDFREYYWKSIFVFGKMGDKAVPFLLTKINDEDLNVRSHAIHLLGKWLMAPEAARPLQERFWLEKDTELQGMILGAIERTDADLEQWKIFFEQVKAKAQSPSAVKFASESLDGIGQTKTAVMEFVGKKRISKADFDREYSKIYRSAGHEGDYEALGVSSSLADEPRLKKLREHILTRNSDESFYDYDKVNSIIGLNRFAARLKDIK
jgi:hypothetical protein